MILAVFGYITVGILSIVTGNNIVRNCINDYDTISELPENENNENNESNESNENDENNCITLKDLAIMEEKERQKKTLEAIPEESEQEIENTQSIYHKINFFPFLGSPDRYVPNYE